MDKDFEFPSELGADKLRAEAKRSRTNAWSADDYWRANWLDRLATQVEEVERLSKDLMHLADGGCPDWTTPPKHVDKRQADLYHAKEVEWRGACNRRDKMEREGWLGSNSY